MAIRLNGIGCGLVIAGMVMAPVFGWIIISDALDTARNYTEVDGMVLETTELCTPKPIRRSKREELEADPRWGVQPWGDCNEAAAYVGSHPDFTIARADRMVVRYVSPADGSEQVSNLLSPAQPVPSGTAIKIYAHDRIAGMIKPT